MTTLAASAVTANVGAASASGGVGVITTVVGGPGVGAARQVGLSPVAFATPAAGHDLYVADPTSNAIRKLTVGRTSETVVAGIGVAGYSGDNGVAVQAGLSDPLGVAVDAHGDVLIADSGNGVVRVVAEITGSAYGLAVQQGDIYTVAGGGVSTANGVAATSASLDPRDVMLDGAGNVVIADGGYEEVRVVAEQTGTFYGQPMVAGDVYTVAGTGVFGYTGNGGSALAAEFGSIGSAGVDHHGNLVIDDSDNQVIRVVASTSGMFYGVAMTAGDVYAVAGNGSSGFSGDGGPATAAQLSFPQSVSVDHAGNLVISDTGSQRVRVVAAANTVLYGESMQKGDIYTVAGDGSTGFFGDGGPALSASFDGPQGAMIDHSGNLIIGDAQSKRVRVVAATSGTYYGVAITADDIATVAGNGLTGSTGNGTSAVNAELAGPQGLASDQAGNLIESEDFDNVVRVTAGSTGTFYGISMRSGDIYTIAGNTAPGFSGDRGLAKAARLFRPEGVGVDAAGDLVIADTDNERIRFVPGASGSAFGTTVIAGHIYTIAGNGGFGRGRSGVRATRTTLYNPSGATFDAQGNLVVADITAGLVHVVARASGTFYNRAMRAGYIYTVAGGGLAVPGDGGPATSAQIGVTRVLVDSAGNLVLADPQNYRLRVVPSTTGAYYGQAMTAGDIYTIAGNGTFGDNGDGGPATSAEVTPSATAFDLAGDLVIADTLSDTMRVVAEQTGTHFGQAMTAGHIYTIAGTGTYGYSGDGGPGTAAQLAQPNDVAVTPAGVAVLADTGNNRLRAVAGP
jgi:hypothetical protein